MADAPALLPRQLEGLKQEIARVQKEAKTAEEAIKKSTAIKDDLACLEVGARVGARGHEG
jgi:hypothetical protein